MGVTLFLAQCGITMMAVYIYAGISAYRTRLVARYKWEYFLIVSLFLLNFIISNVGTTTLTILLVTTGIALHNRSLMNFSNDDSVLMPAD